MSKKPLKQKSYFSAVTKYPNYQIFSQVYISNETPV